MTESEYFKSVNPELRKMGNIYKVGNKKLGNDTIIFNMHPATNCISKKLGLCQLKNPNHCYAWMDEKQYKKVLAYRQRQHKVWKGDNIEKIVKDFIHIKQVRPRIKYIRFNESGDITNLTDIQDLNYIAKQLKPYGITVYTYTSRYDMFKHNNITLVDNLVINGSGFMVHNEFRVVDKSILERDITNGLICRGACIDCVYCKTKLNKIIYEELRIRGKSVKGVNQ